jgi:hypothetical protein
VVVALGVGVDVVGGAVTVGVVVVIAPSPKVSQLRAT